MEQYRSPSWKRPVLILGAILGAAGLLAAAFRTRQGGGTVNRHEARAAWLGMVEAAYPILVFIVLAMATMALCCLLVWRRSPGRVRSAALRGTMLGVAMLFALVLGEGTAALLRSWVHRAPHLAMLADRTPRGGPSDDATIVVVGESSAEGVPYRDWVSVGRIVTWQLRRLFPQRMFHLESQARAGWTLEQMHQKLAESRKRPDMVILYAGHNEFASRYGWSADVPYYQDQQPSLSRRALGAIAGVSPFCGMIREYRDRERVAAPPPPGDRSVVDIPSHSAAQHEERLDDFRHRVEIILGDLQKAGVLTVVIVPPGNDAGFEPNRSVLVADTPLADRQAFAAPVLEARRLETTDPAASEGRYLALTGEHPEFAESHFRLARLLARRGENEAAYREFALARDHDGHPLRCPSAFQDVLRERAAATGAILIDGPAVFHARHPRGQLDDALLNDAMHPSFEGQVALAEAVLSGLKERRAFGWAATLDPPAIDMAECARHFDLTIATWKEVCRFVAGFYRATDPIRYDPAERRAKRSAYEEGLHGLEKGKPPEALGIPGIGDRPVRDRTPPIPPSWP